MEYVILSLLIVIVILLIILVLRKNDNNDVNEKISRVELSLVREIGDFKNDFSDKLNNDFNTLNDRIENKLNLGGKKIE